MFVPSRFLDNPHDPFTPPDRRRRRCEYLIEHGRRPCTTRDDTITWDAWRFFHGLSRCEGEADRKQLERRFPTIAEAYHFFCAAAPLRRSELEARLLADQSDGEIAERMSLSAASVAVYGALCFDVRPHLQADAYILGVVLGGKVHHGLTPDDHELLLKLFGYGLGGPGVDAYLDCLKDLPAVPASLGDLDPPALRKLGGKLRIQLVVLALTTPAAAAHPATWRRLAEQLAASRVPRRDPGQSGAGAPGAVCPAVDAVTLLPGGPAVGEGSGADEAVAGDLLREVSVRLTLCDELAAIRRGYGPIPA